MEGEIRMRRITYLAMVPLMLVVLISTYATPTLAEPTLVFVGSFGGAPVPGHDGLMMVEFLDFRRSPAGRADVLMLSEIVDGVEVPVAVVTDNEEFADGMDEMFAGMVPIVVVEDDELEVWMKGRTMFAELTVEAEPIHPIYAEIKGCSGKPMKGEESETMPDGSTMTMTYIGYEAVVYFVYDDVVCGPIPGIVGPQFLLKITPP